MVGPSVVKCPAVTVSKVGMYGEALQFFAYIPGVIWTIQYLTVTMTFKDHWPHGLAESRLTFITINTFLERDGESNCGR